MSFWKHKKPIQTNHPDFGALEYTGESRWTGKTVFRPENIQVGISLPGNETGPDSFCASEFSNLELVYPTVRKTIATELARIVSDHQSQFADDPETDVVIHQPENVWAALSLISIDIHGENVYALTYCFADSNDDSLFSIAFINGAISAEYLGD